MSVFWKPHKEHDCVDGTARTVYIRGENVPFVGWIATPDTYFSCPAFVRVKGARVLGYVGTFDGVTAFHPLDSHAPLMSGGEVAPPSGDLVPNLDCMPDDDLMPFWQRHQGGRGSRELFPKGGRGTRGATADLAAYASNAATARKCRLRGAINTALQYEDICQRIYDALPPFAKW